MQERRGYETAQIERSTRAPKRWPRRSEAASRRGSRSARQKYCQARVAAQPDEVRFQLKQDQFALDRYSFLSPTFSTLYDQRCALVSASYRFPPLHEDISSRSQALDS